MTAQDLSATRPAPAAERAPTASFASSPDGARAGARLFFADHMRVALTALVVIHHLTLAFAATIPGLWYYQLFTTDGTANTLGLLVVFIDQAFFMGAFFLIAGHFTPSSFDRKGAGAFFRDRFIRLIIPVIAFDVLLGPLASLPAFLKYDGHLTLQTYVTHLDSPGPLWFAELLFLLSCAYVAVRLLRRRTASAPRPVAAEPPRALAILLFTLGLAVVTFAFRQIVPIGYTLPVLQLPTPAYLPQYVSLFVIGIVAAQRGWFRSVPDWMGWTGLGISVVATIVLMVPALLTGMKGEFTGGLHWQAAAYSLWDSTLAVGMFLGLTVIFRRWVNTPGALWNELSRNAFGVYVLHAPLIVGVTLVLAGLPVAPLLKLLVAIVVALPLCFTVAGLVRRIPGVARVL